MNQAAGSSGTLAGKVAIATGRGRGIGRARTMRLAEAGAVVAINVTGANLEITGGLAFS